MNDEKVDQPVRGEASLAGPVISIAFGLLTIWEAWDYPMGTLQRMGPGLFPLALGVILTLLGLALLAETLRRSSLRLSTMNIEYRALFAVSASIVAFALALRPLGLAPAVFLLVMISAIASPGRRPVGALVAAVIFSALNLVLFVYVMDLPFRIVRIPSWMGG